MGQGSTTNSITDTASNVVVSSAFIKGLVIVNTGSSTVYLGTDSSVTDTTGLQRKTLKSFINAQLILFILSQIMFK
jgi:hypothetical protein